jgi:DNA-binding NtrC family response regulator
MQRALLLARGGEILPAHLALGDESGPWRMHPPEGISYEEGKQEALKMFQRRFIERALAAADGNVTHAAARCGLTRAAFQRIMRSLELDRSRFTT